MNGSDDLLGLSTTLVPLRPPPWPEQSFPVNHVVVTGMHRSATSAVTQLLGVNGCDLGDPSSLMPADPANPHGYFENVTLHGLNESLLESLDASWSSPPPTDVVAGASEYLAREIKPVWREILQGYSRGTPIVKDPRFCLLLPAWRQVFGRDTLYVICLRDPLAVARSLLARDQMDVSAGCALWEIYTVACLRGLVGARAIFVDVDALHVDSSARLALVNRVRDTLDLAASKRLTDPFDTEALGPPASSHELFDALSGYQLALHRSLVQLPQDVVVVDDLAHLRVSAAALRILGNSHRLTGERDPVAGRLRQELERERAEVTRLGEALRLAEESRSKQPAAESTGEDLAAARTRIRQLETELRELRASHDTRIAHQGRFDESLGALREQLRSATDELFGLRQIIAKLERERDEAMTAQREAARQLTDAHEMSRQHAESLQQRLDAAILDSRQARTELGAVHRMYAAAFDSRSWRWTRPLRRERRERRQTGEAGDTDDGERHRGLRSADASSSLTTRTAVVAHVFYPELWAPLDEQLANLQDPFDLFVSLTAGHSDGLEKLIHERFPAATIRVCANRGRDVAPFIGFVRSGNLDGYAAILKLHTKRSHHLADGDEWRTALWHGLLPNPADARRFAALVANHPDVGCVVPRGNVRSVESIGSNAERLRILMARVGMDFQADELEFPAGSMCWLDGSIVQLVRAIFADDSTDFEPELGQADGTTAHAFERLLGVLLKRRGQLLIATEDAWSVPVVPDWLAAPRPKVLAFYLPQFHRSAANDEWWGEGFTDWTSVSAAQSWQPGQGLPRRPVAPLNRYDLAADNIPEVQAKVARAHGIDGFLVYHYWFSGRRLLDAPMERVLAHPHWEFPYALVWANENWTRSWDGLNEDVLMAQEYPPGWVEGLFASLLPHLRDERYLRLSRAPLVVVFKPGLVPNLREALHGLRRLARQHAIGDLHIAGVLHDRHAAVGGNIGDAGIDSWIDFPPLSGPTPTKLKTVALDDGTERGSVYDYRDLVDQNYYLPMFAGRTVHPGAMPSWDNTPRRATGASSFINANPADFRRWLIELRRRLAATSMSHETMVCINAWNEWAETAYLEPDERLGAANLEAVRSVFGERSN